MSRGKRKKKRKPKEETEIGSKPEVIEIEAPPVSKELRKRWSYFIRKVYEADPLTCPKCQGEMRIISFIDQPDIIKKSFNTWVCGNLSACGHAQAGSPMPHLTEAEKKK